MLFSKGTGASVNQSEQHCDTPELEAQMLLRSRIFTLRDVSCRGRCRAGVEEHVRTTRLVFPYRGVYVRHLGRDQATGEANQILFFNAEESYRVSHPVAGGDASLSLTVDEQVLEELAPPAMVHRTRP
jgi:AraC family transcriptional regulator